MKIIVRPRWVVPRLDLDVPYIVISITDLRSEEARIPQRCGLRDILRLSFDDVSPGFECPDTVHYREIAMQPSDAKRIWDFVNRWKDEVSAIVVHCEAGVSRSPSVAMAIADCLGWSRSCIDWLSSMESEFSGKDSNSLAPNHFVYRTVQSIFTRASEGTGGDRTDACGLPAVS